jgi:Tfp pilus assembly protein PilF
LDDAATQHPSDEGVQRMRLDLVRSLHKWQMVERALDGYKQALFQARGSATEAHVAAARIYTQLGRWTLALGEYRIALADRAADVSLLVEYGHAAEQAGRHSTAREAYLEAAQVSPNDPMVTTALRSLEDRVQKMRTDPALGLQAP